MPCSKTCAILGDSLTNEASHKLVGVATSLVYLKTRVTTLQALDNDLYSSVLLVGSHFLIGESSSNIYTASRADNKLAPSLRVEIKEYIAIKLVGRKVVSTEHACLLIGCDKTLDRTMYQCLVFHNSHNSSNTHTVIGTKCSTLGTYPIAIYICLNRVGLEVMGRLLCLLWHHIHVSLKNNTLTVLHTRRSRFAHNNVSGSILKCLHSNTGSKVEQELLNFLKMSRWARHLCQCIKVAPNTLGV